MENAQHSALAATRKPNRIASNISSIILGLSLILLIATIAMILSGQKDRNFLGVRFYSVLSDSMKPTFQAGDLVVGRTVDVDTLEKGDIITFKSSDPLSFNHLITHQINKVIHEDGVLSFKTKGVNVAQADDVPASADRVLSKYTFSIPKAGYIFDFFQTTTGYAVLFLLPVLCIIFFQTRKIIRYMRIIKKEQLQAFELALGNQQGNHEKMTEMIEQITVLRAKLHQLGSDDIVLSTEIADLIEAPTTSTDVAEVNDQIEQPGAEVKDLRENDYTDIEKPLATENDEITLGITPLSHTRLNDTLHEDNLRKSEKLLPNDIDETLLERNSPANVIKKNRLLDNGQLSASSLNEDEIAAGSLQTPTQHIAEIQDFIQPITLLEKKQAASQEVADSLIVDGSEPMAIHLATSNLPMSEAEAHEDLPYDSKQQNPSELNKQQTEE